MSDLYIGAYWGPRKESAGQCAERLATCLRELAAASDVFASWYEKGKSRRDATKRPVEPSQHSDILGVLEAGSSKRDIDKSVIEDLGFRVGLWNGASEEHSVSLNVTCGLFAQNANLRNSVVLDFPEILGELGEKDRALQALLAVVRGWEPEWAGIISRASRTTRPFTPGSPFVDWMIYLNRLDIDLSQLPASASVVKVDDQGSIIITQDVPVDANDLSHVQNVRAVEAAIPA